ncbi:MAG: amidophosphoribosyltransferase [Ktedonobacteraceae bacterium]
MCGIFGVFNARKAAELTVIGLHGNQHRAIDYAGIVSSDSQHFYRERGAGLARQVFTKVMLDRLHGKDALGHIRYPTVTDDETRDNIQPIIGRYNGQPVAIAHNGNLTNIAELQRLVPAARLSTSMDSEYLLRLLERNYTGNIEADLRSVFALLKGSFALTILLPNRLIAVRDASGNRPLSIGQSEESHFVSSETCAFPNVGAHHLRDVEPGTVVSISANGIEITRFANPQEKKCRFEGIYFSHPSSSVFGENVSRFRMAIGRELERLYPVADVDIVTPIPDSSNFIAMGYGESGRSGRYLPVIIRNHYVGRTFIAATQARRDAEVAQKFTFTAEEIAGKNIVVVDDSIVRGTTLPKIVSQLRQLGARSVHVRIGSPPIKYPCTYGINTPTREELIAASYSPAEIRDRVGADSLEFLPLEALQELSPDKEKFCFACMSGNYW